MVGIEGCEVGEGSVGVGLWGVRWLRCGCGESLRMRGGWKGSVGESLRGREWRKCKWGAGFVDV